MISPPLVEVEGLSVDMRTGAGRARILRDVSLVVPRGRIVGVVGESGSGKSTLALSILGLLPANALPPAGQIRFDGQALLGPGSMSPAALRGRRIAMIFQDPLSALNPVFTVRTHLVDVLRRRHPGLARKERNRRAAEMMTRVGIPDAERRLDQYPHQFSGGMRQRVMIAMALLSAPDLVVADEPTTALDATTEAQIVQLFAALRADYAGSMLFISHSLGLVAELCDEVAVLYAGTLVESGPAAQVFADPSHPYTRALLACEIVDDGAGGRLPSIPGEVPDLTKIPPGCIFARRCERAAPECLGAVPPLREIGPGQRVACWRA